MRLLKIFILLFIVLGLAVMLSMNAKQEVNIWLMPGKVYQNVSLSTTLVITISLGILLGFIIGLLQIMEHQRTISKQNKQLKKLRTEINNLRHSVLDDEVFQESEEIAITPDGPALSSGNDPPQLDK